MIERELNTIQLYKILSSDNCTKRYFRGVYAIDRLPKKIIYPSFIVINTDKSNGPGMHWICIVYTRDKNAYMYCPLGLHPAAYGLDKYLQMTSIRWNYNKCQYQSFNSNICGYFVFLYLIFACRRINIRLSDSNINKYLPKKY
jgi:hypothetical protein